MKNFLRVLPKRETAVYSHLALILRPGLLRQIHIGMQHPSNWRSPRRLVIIRALGRVGGDEVNRFGALLNGLPRA